MRVGDQGGGLSTPTLSIKLATMSFPKGISSTASKLKSDEGVSLTALQ